MGSTLNLVVVVVKTSDVGASELGDLASGTTNTATDIENLHALLDANLVSKVVLMAGNGLVKGLALGESAEVERLAPAILVEIGSKVVVAVNPKSVGSPKRDIPRHGPKGHGETETGIRSLTVESKWRIQQYGPDRYVSSSYLFMAGHVKGSYSSLLRSLVLSALVIPVLEVLVDSSLLSRTALSEHGSNTSSGLGRGAVHGLVEVGIALVILALEVGGGRRGNHVEYGVKC